jgi:pilus assembly protein CpaB
MGRRVLAIAAALLVALLGAAGVVVYAQSADARAVAGQATQQVYIAAAPVPEGTSADEAVAQKLLVPQSVVARGVPAGALTDVSGATGGLVATSTISQGEIVLASRFGHLVDQQPTSPVPAGRVAITVSLADPQRVAPLLTPGAHLVIYDTFTPKAASSSPAALRTTRILLPDVQVIGVGGALFQSSPAPTPAPTAPAGAEPAASGALVTVAVTPSQAIELVHAVQAAHELYGGLRGEKLTLDPRALVTDDTVIGK